MGSLYVNQDFSAVASLTCRSFPAPFPGWGKFCPRPEVSPFRKWLKSQALQKRRVYIDLCNLQRFERSVRYREPLCKVSAGAKSKIVQRILATHKNPLESAEERVHKQFDNCYHSSLQARNLVYTNSFSVTVSCSLQTLSNFEATITRWNGKWYRIAMFDCWEH